MSIRIKDLTTTASSPASDDYLALDGATNGTRKIAASSLGGASSSDDVTNDSTVTGATVSDALETLSGEIANLEGGAPTPAATVSAMADTTKIYLYTGSETGYNAGHWYYYSNGSWVDGGAYGEAASMSAGVKAALLACFQKVAWIDENGQTYYDNLYNELYPPANLVSITAVYTQSGTVYDTDTLDSLKSDLVVTAHYSDSTTATVTAYTLSGTLSTGISTITASYGGKSTTFTVTVSFSLYPLENGTHEFATTNRSLTVRDGYHFVYTNSNAKTSGTGGYINLSHVSENDASGTTADNYIRQTVWFTIPAGSTYTFSLTNIVLDNLNTTNYGLYFLNGSSQPIKIPDRNSSDDAMISGVASEDMPITALGMYIRNSYKLLECDVSLVVNGQRWV